MDYEPHEFVKIDEQLSSFRGKCLFRQSIKSKPGKNIGDQVEKSRGSELCAILPNLFLGLDNFFSSCELGEFLWNENLIALGTVGKNKPDSHPELCMKTIWNVYNSIFECLLSMQHSSSDIKPNDEMKAIMILDYNKTKGRVDNSDKIIAEYLT